MNPKAKDNLLVETLPEETLVYDLDRHRAHCLNPQAALLLDRADGTRTVLDLSGVLDASGLGPASEDTVRIGLDRLRRAGLLVWDDPFEAEDSTIQSRRAAIRKMATLGLVLPAVMTVVSPATAQGTGLVPGRCKQLEDVGGCCRNRKTCIQVGPDRFRCAGSPC